MAEGSETHSSTSSQQSILRDSLDDQTQVAAFSGLKPQNGDMLMHPMMYPVLVPGLFPPQQGHGQNHGPGLYAVPVLPFMQTIAGVPPNNLIPFTYNIPTERSSPETRDAVGEQGQGEQLHQPQDGGPRRQVVRRFQIAIHLDLFLILKLAAVVFLFNQDGSKQRLAALVFFATLVYLYQTGALAPVIRWLTQGMQRAAVPPRPPRPADRADNLPAVGPQGNENVGIEGEQHVVENEHEREPGQGQGGNRWWALVKEIQLIVFGFVTSLLPGFHNID